MKTKFLFFIVSVIFQTNTFSQVTLGQIDNFEDGTTQSWSEGISSPNPPINISTGGPAGTGDNYLRNVSTGTFAGSKMVIFNNSQWTGDYTTQNIIAIKFDARVSTNNLNLRVALDGTGGRICTTNAVLVTAGSGWKSVTIPITASDFTLAGGTSIASTLAACTQMRILSNTSPSYNGQDIDATLEIDNITASGTLGTEDFSMGDFFIVPNPSKSSIQISFPSSLSQANINIFDVLGKEIYTSKNILDTTIDISNWANGLYLVRISSFENMATKRLIKQ